MDEIKLVCFDLDKTLIKTNSWLQLNLALGISQAEDDEMLRAYRNMEIGYDEWQRKIFAMYKDRGKATKENIFKTLFSFEYVDGVKEIVSYLKSKNYKLAIVSGSVDILVKHIAHDLSSDFLKSHNTFVFDAKGYLEEIVWNGDDVDAKADYLKEISQESGIDLKNIACVGDGANDRELFILTGKGITFSDSSIKDVAWRVINDLSELKLVL